MVKDINHEISTEERILKAAEDEFLKKGFAASRTTAIAEAAGVTHAMLHYYFRTKEKLFERIVGEKIVLIRNMMLGSIGNPDLPLFDKIREMINGHLDLLADNQDMPKFMINEIFSNPERLQLIFSQLETHLPLVVANLQKDIDQLAERGECRRVDIRMLLIDIISLNLTPFVVSPLIMKIYGKDPDYMKEFIETRKKENYETIIRKLKP